MKYIEISGIAQSIRAPFCNRTFEHYNDSIKEIAKALALSHQIDPAGLTILHGVTASGTGYTEGWVFYNGEIFYVEPSTGLTDAANAQLRVKTVFRDGDPVRFTDNNLRNLHADNRMEVVNAAGIEKASTAARVGDLVWHDVAFKNGATGNVQYTKDKNGFVHFRGVLTSFTKDATTGLMGTAFSLPEDHQPADDALCDVMLVCNCVQPSNGTTARLPFLHTSFLSDGSVFFADMAYWFNPEVNIVDTDLGADLSSIRYYAG